MSLVDDVAQAGAAWEDAVDMIRVTQPREGLVPCGCCHGAGFRRGRPGDPYAALRAGAHGTPCPSCTDGWIDPELDTDIYRGEP